jgi:putative transposase
LTYLRVRQVLTERATVSDVSIEKALGELERFSPTRKAALAAYDQFISSYQAKQPKATECREKEWLLTFYNFPAQHRPHLRTTNPIESTFATVRPRTQTDQGMWLTNR